MSSKEVLKKWSSVSLDNGKSKLDKSDLSQNDKRRKPKWLKVKLPTGEAFKKVREITKSRNLHTICESGSQNHLQHYKFSYHYHLEAYSL